MTVARQSSNLIGLSAMALGVLIALQVHLGQWQVPQKKMEHLMYLPDAEYLHLTSMGYQGLVADVLWLQSIQVMGEHKVSYAAGRWLYRAFDIITTLDPNFVRAYEAGGLALTTLVVLPEESNQLLMKGIERNPAEWKLPFYLGINHYFELSMMPRLPSTWLRRPASQARLPGWSQSRQTCLLGEVSPTGSRHACHGLSEHVR